jgi:resolvase-like protein/recombinase
MPDSTTQKYVSQMEQDLADTRRRLANVRSERSTLDHEVELLETAERELERLLKLHADGDATAQKQNWAFVALDCAVDTSTPAGEAMAHVLATFGQFERRLIGQRTKEALVAKKAAGIRLGRPPTIPQSVVRRIQRLRSRGMSLRAIAEELNETRVATAQGGKQWYAATVRHVLLRTS